MARETLVDFFGDLANARGDFLVDDDGFRTRHYSYAAVARAAEGFAARLQASGLVKGDAVLFCSENRAEWVAALWGCVLAGVVAVPLDYRSSPAFAAHVREIVKARRVLVGDEATLAADAGSHGIPSEEIWRLRDFDWKDSRRPGPVPHAADDIAEIIFTSGATAAPKGVVITHRNVLANILPIEREVAKYRSWGRPFFPLRFLNLLPLSHMFGQAMATFIPPMLPGIVVFSRDYSPADIVRQIAERRVSVVVSVPKILEVLREHLTRAWPETAAPLPRPEHVAWRWWRYRRVHKALGLKFWSFVVGGAPLDASLEEFWSRLGFVVIQGYGLTETAPIVTLNHPFAARKGSVGKALAGTEVRLAPDGEILVRGGNVTPGYYGAARETEQAFDGDWLHTGDIGELDDEGRLFVRGRKKEMIVTPQGLNVFPEDVERVLAQQPGVSDSAVVGVVEKGEERVHAVVRLESGADLDAVVRAANARLADHQRIRGASAWPGEALPRTEGSLKLKRGEIRQWVETGRAPTPSGAGVQTAEGIIARFAEGRPLRPDTTIEELGLSSLDRVELMVALESRLGRRIDETRFAEARTVRDVETLLSLPGTAAAIGNPEAWAMPSWNRRLAARWFRRASLATWVLPLARVFAHIRVEGLDHLHSLDAPVLFASNHQSHLDTPVIFAALPPEWRGRLAVAMAKEFFDAHFHPAGHPRGRRLASGALYGLAALFFNAFPLPQREAGARRTLRYIGELLGDGWSVLIYPEGERTDDGTIRPFRPGIGMVAARLGVPVVPVRLEGLERVLHRSWRMARPGPVRVAFGPPLTLRGEEYEALAREVEEAVRAL